MPLLPGIGSRGLTTGGQNLTFIGDAADHRIWGSCSPPPIPMSLSQPRFRRWEALDKVGVRIPSQVTIGDRSRLTGTITSAGFDHDSVTAAVSRPGSTEAPDVCDL